MMMLEISQMAALKTVSLWVLILILCILLIPLIDMFWTTLQISWLRHKMRKELRKAVKESTNNIYEEISSIIDEMVDDSFANIGK